ncbi:lysophospholipid acyltransferase family protein [Cupriavidus neocaledonicus]|uniref:Lipid A biosynthesis acyltransferase n=1 Tax=Cupriavidus neocaledonicus TaxID=1040979 RepID=A0A375H2U9_9BURK|nr:lysophospholipid acyltransferase family protein [Cupriavidus neocaledonicus]SOZ36610.1 putative lipid A biosynthesis acyltransferase [Cupriavidus neocaledonicus]SPD45266.1 putative lipid A biosynthesis acyltransferase [Cupriavidus neocaledonicus]
MTFLFWLISRFPLRLLQAAGGALGLLIARLPGRYGQRLRENFRLAFPDATEAMIDEAARSAGRMIIEMPYFWSRRRIGAKLYGFDDHLWPELATLQARGKGIIILTPHLGCFEVLPQSHALHRPVTALFKPPHQPWLRDWIEKMRTRPNMHMAPATPRGVRMLVKALKRGQAVGILPDQVPSGGEGNWAPFFGKPAYTMALVHRLQQLTGAPVVAIFAERLPRGAGYRGHLRVVEDGGMLPDDPAAAAAVINRTIEELVRLCPTQYLWGYNRYKQPAGAGTPGTPDTPDPEGTDSEPATDRSIS